MYLVFTAYGSLKPMDTQFYSMWFYVRKYVHKLLRNINTITIEEA